MGYGMRVLFRGLGVAASLLVGPSAAAGQTGQFAGVDTLRVYVGSLGSDVPTGLTQDTVRHRVETALAAAGIAIDSAEESAAPALRLGFSIRRLEGGWVIVVRAELIELSVSLREYVREVARRSEDPSRGATEPDSVLGGVMRNLPTWSRLAVATSGTDAGAETALGVVDQLVAELTGAISADNQPG
jgi:hypothetical protein